MTVNEMMERLLKSQELTPVMNNDLLKHRVEVETFLREKFGDEPTIRYAGSKAKGTMVKENYDLDIVCYFPRDCEREIEEIYKDVRDKLQEKYSITPKSSALRVQKTDNKISIDYHIDVVPGRFIDDKQEDAFVYVASGKGGRIKTNLDKHIKFIKDSGCVDIIKLAKLWNIRNVVNIKTFVLELLVVRCLNGVQKNNLKNCFMKFLECLKNDISDIRLEDPANQGNIVSDDWSDAERSNASSKASSALDSVNDDSDNVDLWKQIFMEPAEDKYVSTGSTVIRSPSKPWSY